MKKYIVFSILACIAIFYSCTYKHHDKQGIYQDAFVIKTRTTTTSGCGNGNCHGTLGVTDLKMSGKEVLVVQRKHDSFTVGEHILIDSARLEGDGAYLADTNDWESPGRPWYKADKNDSVKTPSSLDTALVKTIEHGGSLCGTLDVTVQSAKRIAKNFHLRSYWRKGKYIVVVHTGDMFIRRNGQWYLFSPLKRIKGYNSGYGNY